MRPPDPKIYLTTAQCSVENTLFVRFFHGRNETIAENFGKTSRDGSIAMINRYSIRQLASCSGLTRDNDRGGNQRANDQNSSRHRNSPAFHDCSSRVKPVSLARVVLTVSWAGTPYGVFGSAFAPSTAKAVPSASARPTRDFADLGRLSATLGILTSRHPSERGCPECEHLSSSVRRTVSGFEASD